MQTKLNFFKLDLKLPEGQLAVQSFQGAIETPILSSLIFQRLIQAFDFPYLPFLLNQELANHLCALLYESADNVASQNSFFSLEQLLLQGTNNGNPIFMAEFSDLKNVDNIYIVAHIEDRPGLGVYFTMSRLAIFKFTYVELFGEGMDSIINYIKAVKIAKDEILIQSLALKEEIEQKVKESTHYAQMSTYLYTKMISLKDEHDYAANQIDLLNEKLKCQQKSGQGIIDQELECLLCRSSVKNIVFLPCGHIVACKECTVIQMRLALNKTIGRRAQNVLCPLCKGKIREAREVYF